MWMSKIKPFSYYIKKVNNNSVECLCVRVCVCQREERDGGMEGEVIVC